MLLQSQQLCRCLLAGLLVPCWCSCSLPTLPFCLLQLWMVAVKAILRDHSWVWPVTVLLLFLLQEQMKRWSKQICVCSKIRCWL